MLGGEEGDVSDTDLLFGGEGNDTLVGGPAVTEFQGGAGRDSFQGNGTDDTVRYVGQNLRLNLSDALASTGEARGDTFTGIERLVFEGGDSTLVGGAGAMTYEASSAGLYVFAGSGAERMIGDLFLTVDYTRAGGAVTILHDGSQLAGNRAAAGDVLSGVDELILTARADRFTQTSDGAVSTVLSGLSAGGGDDRLVLNQSSVLLVDAGLGNDTVQGTLFLSDIDLGAGNDVATVTRALPGSGSLSVNGQDGADAITLTIGGAGQGATFSPRAGSAMTA